MGLTVALGAEDVPGTEHRLHTPSAGIFQRFLQKGAANDLRPITIKTFADQSVVLHGREHCALFLQLWSGRDVWSAAPFGLPP